MKEFEKFSSLRANVEKCEAYWIEKAAKNEQNPVKCKWSSLTKKNNKDSRTVLVTIKDW